MLMQWRWIQKIKCGFSTVNDKTLKNTGWTELLYIIMWKSSLAVIVSVLWMIKNNNLSFTYLYTVILWNAMDTIYTV